MQASPSLSLQLPGEQERESWRSEAGEWRHTDERGTGAAGVFALEALALESVPFWAVEPKDGNFDAGKVASLKWESLGLGENSDGKSSIHWIAGRSGNRVLIASAGLAAEGANPEWLKSMPAAFEISPRLFPIPHGEAALWRELGRCVAAFMHGDELVHFSVMSAQVLNAEAAREFQDLLRAMQVQGFVKKISGVRLWTEAEPAFAATLKDLLQIPVHAEPKPQPSPMPEGCGICPPEVARMRRERRKKRQRTQMVMALAALYFAFFAAWAGWLSWREHKLAKESIQVAALRPQVDQVRQEQVRWQVLEMATDANLYPVELFHRIVSLLPPEGIRLKELDVDLNKIVVTGEASSIGHAKKFQADVNGNDGLKQYTWNCPQPTFLDDNRANFRAEGILSSAGGAP